MSLGYLGTVLYTDIKYAGLIGHRLERFKVKSHQPYVANFRCPECGDGNKRNRTRGYMFTAEQSLRIFCHNCQYSASFSHFLRGMDEETWREYRAELWRERNADLVPSVPVTRDPEKPVDEAPGFEPRDLASLDRGHPTVLYATRRHVSEELWSDLYHADDSDEVHAFVGRRSNVTNRRVPRLMIPMRDRDGGLVGVTARDTTGEDGLRYLTCRARGHDDSPLIWGLDRVDEDRTVLVVEGPLDAMLLPNAVSAGGTNLSAVRRVLPDADLVLVFDNQNRNPQVCGIMRRAIGDGERVVVWPDGLEAKDAGEMVDIGLEPDRIIPQRTFYGPRAMLEFNRWRRCRLKPTNGRTTSC